LESGEEIARRRHAVNRQIVAAVALFAWTTPLELSGKMSKSVLGWGVAAAAKAGMAFALDGRNCCIAANASANATNAIPRRLKNRAVFIV
jgi:hypothetical protein